MVIAIGLAVGLTFAFTKDPSPDSSATCIDGIQNQGETGIDCGGPCPARSTPELQPSCSDGIQNQGETGVDCGGPNCLACPTPTTPATCSDGIQNQGETGVDCGGLNCPVCPTSSSGSYDIQIKVFFTMSYTNILTFETEEVLGSFDIVATGLSIGDVHSYRPNEAERYLTTLSQVTPTYANVHIDF